MLMKSPVPHDSVSKNPHRQQKFHGSVSLSKNRKGKFIHIRAGHNLDLTNVSIFNEAVNLSNVNPGVRKVVVDLGLTQQIFDSGKAILLLLRNQLAPTLREKVFLINAQPEIARELSPYCENRLSLCRK